MIKFKKILIVTILSCLTSKLLFANLIKNNDYLSFNVLSIYNNSNILNLAPRPNFNSLNNKFVNFFTANTEYNFLNLPINNMILLNSFFLSNFLIEDQGKGNSLLSNYLFTNLKPSKNRIATNEFISSNNLSINSKLIAYDNEQQYNFLIAINYDHIKNIVKNSSNKTLLNNYNSLISFEYTPIQDETSLKFTYLSSLINGIRSIDKNKDASLFFSNNKIKQVSFGNIITLIYKDSPKNNPLWNYSSNLSFSNQYTNFDQKGNLVGAPQIYYSGFSYKVGNTSKINLLNNDVALNYGLNFGRNSTKSSMKNSNLIVWPTGKEDNYNMYINSVFNFNKLYIATGGHFNYLSYKSEGFNSYTESYFSPLLDVSLKPIKGITINVTYLYKRRLPYLYEKYITGKYFYNDNFVNFKSNYDLKKESNNQFTGNVTLDYYLNKPEVNITANIEAFYYRINNYISYNFLNTEEIMLSNISSATLSGYKVSLSVYNNSKFSSNIYYNFIKGKDNLTNSYLNNLYPSSVVIETMYKVTSLDTNIGVRASLFKSFSNFSNNYKFNKDKLPGYGLLDIYFEYLASNKVSFILGVNNIFNKYYYTPYVDSFNKQRSYYFNFNIKL